MIEEYEEEVVNAAKYLRGVRALDPSELCEYVTGDVSPAEVGSVLRAHAFELQIIATPEGTYISATDDPVINEEFEGVTRFPDRYCEVIQSALLDRYGKEWAHGRSGDRLREAIRSFKASYLAGQSVTYDRDVALGYAIYHAPNYYAAIQYVLDELASNRLIPGRLHILDVGTGVGGPALGIHDYLPEPTLVKYNAVEPSASTGLLGSFLETTGENFHWQITEQAVETFDPGGPYDLIVFANVLSELADPVATVTRLGEALAADGTIVAIAPADKQTSLQLREIERTVVDRADAFDIFSPTMRLWPDRSPTDACWSFVKRSSVEVPQIQRSLDEGKRGDGGTRDPATGEFTHTTVQYSYSILRRDGNRRVQVRPTREAYAPLDESEAHVTKRINIMAVKLSNCLADAGEHPVYRIGDGSQTVSHFAVLTDETSLNRTLREVDYGTVVRIKEGLLLWNAEQGAYNVVVDADTIVDIIG